MPDPISAAAQEFGSRLREARQKFGATLEEVGEYSGIDPTTVGKIERGERNTNLHNIVRLADAVGIDPARLVEGIGADLTPGREPGPTALERMRDLRRKHGLG